MGSHFIFHPTTRRPQSIRQRNALTTTSEQHEGGKRRPERRPKRPGKKQKAYPSTTRPQDAWARPTALLATNSFAGVQPTARPFDFRPLQRFQSYSPESLAPCPFHGVPPLHISAQLFRLGFFSQQPNFISRRINPTPPLSLFSSPSPPVAHDILSSSTPPPPRCLRCQHTYRAHHVNNRGAGRWSRGSSRLALSGQVVQQQQFRVAISVHPLPAAIVCIRERPPRSAHPCGLAASPFVFTPVLVVGQRQGLRARRRPLPQTQFKP